MKPKSILLEAEALVNGDRYCRKPCPLDQKGCWNCASCQSTDATSPLGNQELWCLSGCVLPRWEGFQVWELRSRIAGWLKANAKRVQAYQVCGFWMLRS